MTDAEFQGMNSGEFQNSETKVTPSIRKNGMQQWISIQAVEHLCACEVRLKNIFSAVFFLFICSRVWMMDAHVLCWQHKVESNRFLLLFFQFLPYYLSSLFCIVFSLYSCFPFLTFLFYSSSCSLCLFFFFLHVLSSLSSLNFFSLPLFRLFSFYLQIFFCYTFLSVFIFLFFIFLDFLAFLCFFKNIIFMKSEILLCF